MLVLLVHAEVDEDQQDEGPDSIQGLQQLHHRLWHRHAVADQREAHEEREREREVFCLGTGLGRGGDLYGRRNQ